MEIFAERLKDLRVEKNMSQRQLSKAIGVSQTAIVMWEKELREPTATSVVALAKYFGVTTDYLLGMED